MAAYDADVNALNTGSDSVVDDLDADEIETGLQPED